MCESKLATQLEQIQQSAKAVAEGFKVNGFTPPGRWNPFLFLIRDEGCQAACIAGAAMHDPVWRSNFVNNLVSELLTQPAYQNITALAVLCESVMMDMRNWSDADIQAMEEFKHPVDTHPHAQHVLSLTVITAARGLEVYAAPVMMGSDGYYQLGEFERMSDPSYDKIKTIWQPVIDLFRFRN